MLDGGGWQQPLAAPLPWCLLSKDWAVGFLWLALPTIRAATCAAENLELLLPLLVDGCGGLAQGLLAVWSRGGLAVSLAAWTARCNRRAAHVLPAAPRSATCM